MSTRLVRALVWCCVMTPSALAAQEWQAGEDLPLVRDAAAARARRDADVQLAGWQARARGVLRFAAVVDHGGIPVERVIRADELRVEVYGRAPNLSKQIITAWRDTTFLANTLRYHRDHLGIVSSDFGPIIRLGDGEEVADVIHPLSLAGLGQYQFRLGDTIRIAATAGTLRVIRVDVRPVDPHASGTIGTLYLDTDRAALVQFRFTFTAESYRDPTVESITVMLENGLQDNAAWLPWRQAITIRRAIPWLDMPFRTVLRADWTIDEYELGVSHLPDRFGGRPVAGLLAPGGVVVWDLPLVASLAELPATQDDVEALARRAGQLRSAARLDGLPVFRIAAGGLSEFLHVNRAQGITPRAGVSASLGPTRVVDGYVGVGLSNRRVVGRIGLTERIAGVDLTVVASRDVRDVSDRPFGSRLANSLGTLVNGADAGHWYGREQVAIRVTVPQAGRVLGLEVARERAHGLDSRFLALDGTQRANPDLGSPAATVAKVTLHGGPEERVRWDLTTEAGFAAHSWGRISASASGSALGRLRWRAEGGAGSVRLPPYRHFVIGGRGSLVGVPTRAIGGRRYLFGEISMPIAMGVPSPPLGRLGSVSLPTTWAPFVAVGRAGGNVSSLPWHAADMWEAVLGMRLDLWGPLLRLEAGWSPRRKTVGFTIDAHPDWWPLL